MSRTRYFHRGNDLFTITENWEQTYIRSVPPRDISDDIWSDPGSQESVTTNRTSRGKLRYRDGRIEEGPLDSWQVSEDRPAIEVQIEQMWRTDQGGARVRLAVLHGESEKTMKQGDDLVHLRLQGVRHYDLIADEWGWPLEMREADDYRLVQILRRDIPIIEPPVPLALPKTGA